MEQTRTFLRLPCTHHKHLKSTNMLERLNEVICRRTYVVRIFLNPEGCLRLISALAAETHENWMEASRYINMDDLREHKKPALRQRSQLFQVCQRTAATEVNVLAEAGRGATTLRLTCVI